MKNIFKYVVLFLYSSSVFAASAQLNNVVNRGVPVNGSSNPVVVEPLSNIINRVWLRASFETPDTGEHFFAFQEVGAASNATYQVPNGKTLFCPSMMIGTTGSEAQILFGTSTATFSNDAASVTGPVYYSTGSAVVTAAQGWHFSTAGSPGAPLVYPYYTKFAQNLFPFAKMNGGNPISVELDCFLQ